MSRQYPQTWDLLVTALGKLDYQREVPPKLYKPPVPEGQEEVYCSARFRLLCDVESNYAILYIYTYNPNTYHQDEMRHTRHEFVVPVATYHELAWARWIFERIASIEHHETCENFFYEGARIYAPHHGNGWDPYTFWPGHDITEKAKAPGDD